MIEADEVREPLVRWITFQLGDEHYGVEVIHVREILRVGNIFPVPGSPDCVLGVTNIRGSVITIVDGRKRFRLPATTHTDASRIIVIEVGEEEAGILVDRVTDVVDLPVSGIDVTPKLNSRENSSYVAGVVNQDHGLIIMLDVNNLFTEEESSIVVGF